MKWTELPVRVRIYIIGLVLLATPIYVKAFREVVGGSYGYEWLILTAITLITVPLFVFLPSVSTTVGIGDGFVISICMLYGPSPAILANTLYTMFQSLLLRHKHKVSIHRAVFNIAVAVLNVWLYSFVYFSLNPSGSHSLEKVILPTFGLAVSFFLSNSLLVATAVSLSTGTSLIGFWFKNYRPLIL